MTDMILHCGGKVATMEEVGDVPVPDGTDSYRPVPHLDIDRLIRRRMQVEFGLAEPRAVYGMNHKGTQLFATLTYDLSHNGDRVDLSAFEESGGLDANQVKQAYGFTIGFRNSYDKSMSLGVAGGLSLFICDNLCLHGSAFTILYQHSKKVWDKLVPEMMQKVAAVSEQYVRTVRFCEAMKEIEVSQDRAYEVIGLARGRSVLTTGQMERTIKAYRNMQKEGEPFHGNRATAFGLYQAVTDGLKLGTVTRKIDQYTGASDLFEELELVPPMYPGGAWKTNGVRFDEARDVN